MRCALAFVAESVGAKESPMEDSFVFRKEYAWNWFSLHAKQRTSIFNYFVVMAGFLVNAFSTATIKERLPVACAIAVLGVFASGAFFCVDIRNTHLVDLGKARLEEIEKEIFSAGGIISEDSERWRHKHFLRGVVGILGLGFLVASGWAFWAM